MTLAILAACLCLWLAYATYQATQSAPLVERCAAETHVQADCPHTVAPQ